MQGDIEAAIDSYLDGMLEVSCKEETTVLQRVRYLLHGRQAICVHRGLSGLHKFAQNL